MQLEDKVREKISDEYKEKVTFQKERDLFLRYVIFTFNLGCDRDYRKLR